MSATQDEAAVDPSARLEEARRLAEDGDLDRAAELFGTVLDLGDVADRAQAALGLAVVREGLGDHEGAREADRVAIATGDAEYGARAAYHLALSYERAGEREQARSAWQAVVDFDNPAYLPPAFLALARVADDEGDASEARAWWERTVATGDDRYGRDASYDLGLHLLDAGDAPAAQRVLGAALGSVDRAVDPHTHARLAIGVGIAHLEQAITALGGMLVREDADPDVVPLGIELLARTLALRGRDDAAREVWRRGLDDPGLAEAVRDRLARAFGADDPWWRSYVEAWPDEA